MSCVFSPASDLVSGSYWYKWRQSTETKMAASTLSSIKTYYSRAERDTRGVIEVVVVCEQAPSAFVFVVDTTQ
jgi:hypothetical protein